MNKTRMRAVHGEAQRIEQELMRTFDEFDALEKKDSAAAGKMIAVSLGELMNLAHAVAVLTNEEPD